MDDFNCNWRKQQELRGRDKADTIYRRDLNACDVERQNGNELDRKHGIDALIELSSYQTLSVQEKFLSKEYLSLASLTIEEYNDPEAYAEGDWFTCIAELYFVGYGQLDDYVIVSSAMLKTLTSFGRLFWRRSRNTRDGAKANFRFLPIEEIPESCLIARRGFGLPPFSLYKPRSGHD